MSHTLLTGVLLALSSGILNGTFTLPMRFLGRWSWENVWSLFIAVSCLAMPTLIVLVTTPHAWMIVSEAPRHALLIAVAAGFAWGFGAIMFGQSVSAIGISLANTLVLAISSSLGSILPILLLAPHDLFLPTGEKILVAVVIELIGIALCGWAGHMREAAAGVGTERGGMVGHARPV